MPDRFDNDDETRGQIVSRREALILLGATGLAMVTGCAGSSGSGQGSGTTTGVATAGTTTPGDAQQPSCVVRPELTEGPYFVDEQLDRSDIRTDPATGSAKPGVPLRITFNVSTISSGTCAALAGAMVDIWHCDHLGQYSGVTDPGFQTQGSKFLRGYQRTDATGKATFDTVYPGWYGGRAVHIHFKIRSDAPGGRGAEFTSQLFFDEGVTDRVHAQAPYNEKGRRDRINSNDGIFRRAGSQLLLPVSPTGRGGYTGVFGIALQTV